MTKPKMSVQRKKLERYVAELEKDPKADQALLAAARKAMADYDALPDHLKAYGR